MSDNKSQEEIAQLIFSTLYVTGNWQQLNQIQKDSYLKLADTIIDKVLDAYGHS